jgi:hypothetical protein
VQGGAEPRWGRRGRELYFRHGDSVYAVAMPLGEEIRARPPHVLFGGKYDGSILGNNVFYDVSADGDRFLMLRPQPGTSSEQLTVGLNWFDHLGLQGTSGSHTSRD